ncbi:MAG: DUF4177 domain-containing protein [Alphaproteobacteria bacterium]|jgi:hypothetical protein|nr:DUF4177 domain-containing protein [Alphaproteobacteria bacterium]
MQAYEYKVVPAPKKGVKAKGVKGPEARFAHALQLVMNEMGAEGWEYQRTDTLPCEERQGLTGKTTQFRHVLVFRRLLPDDAGAAEDTPLIEDHSADTPAAIPAEDADGAEESAAHDSQADPDTPPEDQRMSSASA